jgi:hypothetical protein
MRPHVGERKSYNKETKKRIKQRSRWETKQQPASVREIERKGAAAKQLFW